MNCREMQEKVLESSEHALSPLESNQLDGHLSQCAECTRFAVLQNQLDLRLHDGIPTPRLSPGFRMGLQARIARERRESWPDWLPDVAHLAGAGVAIGVCALLLPLPTPAMLETGALVAFVTYSLQTLVVSILEQKTD